MSDLTNIAELLGELDVKDARIAELEAEARLALGESMTRADRAEEKAEKATLALSRYRFNEVDPWRRRAEKAEAELAERDTMLRLVWADLDVSLWDEGKFPSLYKWLANLRARAERGTP